MKAYRPNYRKIMLALLLIASMITALPWAVAWAGQGSGPGLPQLNDTEATWLTYMREEEKMARDVYLVMDDYWDARVFAKIAVSEQQHMDTMKAKIDKYGLPDPVLPIIGLFTDDVLQGKYDELVASGVSSLIDGLYAGATIEEIDMVDIQAAINATNHVDLVVAYQNLLEGSKSHLRAFVNTLAKQGFTYTPQFISQELFDAIMEQL